MKSYLPLILLIFVFGCSSQPIPDWTYASSGQLESFKENFMEGKDQIAQLHFNKALAEIKKSGNLEVIGRAYLTRCAFQIATLEDMDDADFLKVDAIEPDRANGNFWRLLKGAPSEVDAAALPEQYGEVAKILKGEKGDLAKNIASIDDSVSRLVACGIVVKMHREDEEVLKTAVATASRQGWRKPLLAYMERLQKFYADHAQMEKAENMRQRLELIR
ncbi:MAG: hypothetical protein PHY31_00230 [Smithellaceae bacterium]|nr:hypothetical protein [Smithellaceae bacterium]